MKIKDWLFKLLPMGGPTTRRINHLIEPGAVAHTLSADRLQGILRQAEGGDMEDYFALARDVLSGHGHTQAEYNKRLLAVVGCAASFVPPLEKDEFQVAIAAEIQSQCEALPNWLDIQLWLLGSTILPLRLVEKTYRPSTRPGMYYELDRLTMVPDRLLDFSTGDLMIWDTDENGNKTGTRHCPDPMRYIIHRGHTLTGYPDTWGGPFRAVLFWYLFAVQDRSWWARFLDRFGAPFMEAQYDENDENARYTLAQAFSSATKLFGIAVPKNVILKMHQASTQGADAFEKFHDTANAEISKIIIGQTMSAEAANTGLGSSQGNMQEGVRQDFRQFDSMRLAHCLKSQLFRPLAQLNGWTAPLPNITWGGEDPTDMAATSTFISALPSAGLEVTDEGVEQVSKRSGIPVRRATAANPPLPGLALAADDALRPLLSPAEIRTEKLRNANDAIARDGASDFAEAMGDMLEPVRRILVLSTSQDDFERRMREAFPSIKASKAAGLLMATMVSNAANAVLTFPDPKKP